MKKRIIVFFMAVFFCSMAVAQITSDRIYSKSYQYSDDDIIISDIQYFDTLYHISNVNVSDEYIGTQLFSDSLHPGSPLPCQVRQLGLHHPAKHKVL